MSSPEDITDAELPTIDPYEVLGLERDATADQIKSAYRKAALKNHPGTNPSSSSLPAPHILTPPRRQGPPRETRRSPHNLPIHRLRLRRPLRPRPPHPLRPDRLDRRVRLRRRLRLGLLLPRPLRGRRLRRRHRPLRGGVPLLGRGEGRCPLRVHTGGGGHGRGVRERDAE